MGRRAPEHRAAPPPPPPPHYSPPAHRSPPPPPPLPWPPAPRLSINQESAHGSARQLQGHAGEAQTSALRIAGAPRPSMPGSLAARVADTTCRISSSLQGHAQKLGTQSSDLHRRADTFEGGATAGVRTLSAVTGVQRGNVQVAARRGSAPRAPSAFRRSATGVATSVSAHSLGALAVRGQVERAGSNARVARASLETLYGGAVDRYGLGSPQAYDALKTWYRVNSQRMSASAIARALEFPDKAGAVLGKAARIVEATGKFTPWLALVTDGIQVVTPEHHGWRAVPDRAVAATDGTALMLYGLDAVSLIEVPGIGEAVIVIGAGVAAWQLGNFLYDERGAIEKGIAGGARWIEGHSYVIASVDPALAGALAVYDHRKQIVGAAETAARTVEHTGGVALKDGLHLGGDLVHGVGHLGSSALHTGEGVVHSMTSFFGFGGGKKTPPPPVHMSPVTTGAFCKAPAPPPPTPAPVRTAASVVRPHPPAAPAAQASATAARKSSDAGKAQRAEAAVRQVLTPGKRR